MKVVSRLRALTNQLSNNQTISRTYATMADLSIHTKHQMLSGYDIPALGFGVSVDPLSYVVTVVWSHDDWNAVAD